LDVYTKLTTDQTSHTAYRDITVDFLV